MIMILSAILGGCVVLIITLVALFGWGGLLTLPQRLGLAAIAAGIVWAGPGRALGREPGLGDALWLIGLLIYLVSTYGPKLFEHADALDGAADGRVEAPFAYRNGRLFAKNITVDQILPGTIKTSDLKRGPPKS